MSGWFGPRPLLPILAVALVLRLAAAGGLQYALDHHWHRNYLIEGDAEGYWELGRALARDGRYVARDPPRYAERMPGFPLLLAGVMTVFGERRFAARLVLAVMGALACGAVYLFGRSCTDERTALLAAGLTAISPVMVGFSPVILSETTFAAALTVSLWGLARMFQTCNVFETPPPVSASLQRKMLATLLAGGLCGAAVYVRPSWLLFPPFLLAAALAVSANRRSVLIYGGLLVTTVLVALLPWAVRNRAATGHLVFTTLWAGPSLYDGLNPGATGDSDMTFYERDRLNHQMTEYEVDREYRRRAWEFVRENPGRTLELAALKLARFWKPWPNARQFDHWTLKLATALVFVPIVILALVGAWESRRNVPLLLLAAGPILYFSLLHLIFVGSLRYRLPAEYPLYVLSAAGARRLWSWSAPRPVASPSSS